MEIDYNKLKEFGIANNGKKKQFCPECHANRTDKRDKSLSVDWDKCIAHCHYCGKNFFFGKTEKIGYAPKVVYQQPKTEMKGYKKPSKLTNKEPLDENMKQWFANRGIPAEVAELEGIFTASDVKEEMEALFEKGLQKGATLDMGDLDELLSVKVGRLMIVTGIPGDGKSEFLDEMAIRFWLRYNWRCAWFSPENFPVTLHHPKLMEKLIGKRFMKGLMKQQEFDAAVVCLSRNFFDILPEEGYRVDTILEKAETLVRRKGIRIFILDPYNCLEHQIPSGQSETQYISEFLEKLRSFARRRQVLVILAAHPTKMKRDPLTKQFPVPTMYDISGSAAFFNKADFGIAIERDRTRGVTRVHVQKVKFRHLGQPGVASFQYNTCCGRFVPMQESKTPDIPDEDPKWDNSNWLAKKLPEQGSLGLV